ncbi:hypothetical protein BV20DRAFT_969528 [Pilatotrama ljubarskyi]|nr:hypothetical protein BV20DRAFT_969528 [Pilatotrama ljubarskyi]
MHPSTFTKLAVIAVHVAMAMASPTSLEARQLTCLADLCTPGAADACCSGATCSDVAFLGLPLPGVGIPAPNAREIAYAELTDVPSHRSAPQPRAT